jgi:hypothetical protein
MTDKELRLLLGDYGIEDTTQFVKDLNKDQKVEIKGLLDQRVMQEPSSYAYDPVSAPRENLGMNPNNQPMAMQVYQGANYAGIPLSLLGGGNTQVGGGVKGAMFGGRVGAEMNLSPEQQLALGVSGGGTRMTYGIGQPYEGQANRSDIMGIDATMRDLARNQEFGAAYQKDPKMNPFLSLFYRKQF